MTAGLFLAALMQAAAVGYGIYLLSSRRGAAAAWTWLLLGMLSMLSWRVVVLLDAEPPPFFNLLIAMWGSTCMLVAMFLFGREVQRRQRAEAERDALLASERAARQDAERASRLKDDFLATLSHELRTPLAAILGWCAVVRQQADPKQSSDPLSPDLQRAIDTIERNAKAQVRLVDDLLDVTRMRAGSLHLDFAVLALDFPVRNALQAVLPQAQAKAVTLQLDCDAAPVVHGDAGRLQQITSNLLVNAVKFTPPGGRVTVSLATVDRSAVLRVADTGEGIDPAVLPLLFERFRQGDSSVARRHGGLGLGLSIVATLVRMHGGEVRAQSDGKGKGAVFTLTLPVFAGAPVAGADLQSGDAVDMATGLAGMRVLVVDDEDDVRSAVTRTLEQRGATVMALDSGDGIEAALADFEPDAMLVDIGMPGEDGYTLMRRLRRLPASSGGSSVPAISLTAHARAEDRSRALAAGFQDHLPKPVDVPELVRALARLRRPRTHDSVASALFVTSTPAAAK